MVLVAPALARRRRVAALALALVALIAPTARAQDTDAKAAAPTKLWAAQTSPTGFTLVWAHPAKRATGYEIGVRRPDGTVAVIARGLAPGVRQFVVVMQAAARAMGINDAQLVGTAMQFVIAAIHGGQRSDWTDFNTIAPAKQSAAKSLVAPSNAGAHEMSPGVIRISWGAVEGATAYTIGRAAGNQGFRPLCALCPTTTTYIDSVPTAGLTYRYTIAAVTPNGTSPRVMTQQVTASGAVATVGGGTSATGGTTGGTPGGATGDTAATGKEGAKDALQQPPTKLSAKGLAGGTGRRVRVTFVGGIGAVAYRLLRGVCDGPLVPLADQLVPGAGQVIEIIDDLTGVPDMSCATDSRKGAAGKTRVTYVLEGRDAKGRTLRTKLAPVTLP